MKSSKLQSCSEFTQDSCACPTSIIGDVHTIDGSTTLGLKSIQVGVNKKTGTIHASTFNG